MLMSDPGDRCRKRPSRKMIKLDVDTVVWSQVITMGLIEIEDNLHLVVRRNAQQMCTRLNQASHIGRVADGAMPFRQSPMS